MTDPDPTFSLEVETADLRRALKVIPHFTYKGIDDLERIRLTANATTTTLAATNGSAAGLGLVSTIALSADGADEVEFDLSPADCKKILDVFPGKAGTDDEPGDELRLDVDEEHITVTDASGMFEGQQLILPRTPMRDLNTTVVKVLGRYMHNQPAGSADGLTNVFGPHLALFIRASTVYGPHLLMEHHQPGKAAAPVLLIRAGDSFIGSLVQHRFSEDEAATHAGHRKAWERRIPKSNLKAVR